MKYSCEEALGGFRVNVQNTQHNSGLITNIFKELPVFSNPENL